MIWRQDQDYPYSTTFLVTCRALSLQEVFAILGSGDCRTEPMSDQVELWIQTKWKEAVEQTKIKLNFPGICKAKKQR